MNRIYVVGLGPGDQSMTTAQALDALEESQVIVGYTVYINLLGDRYKDKELLTTPMKQEKERCKLCFEKANEGKTVLVNTLEIQELQKVADRCLVFYDGQIAGTLSHEEIEEHTVMMISTGSVANGNIETENEVETQ